MKHLPITIAIIFCLFPAYAVAGDSHEGNHAHGAKPCSPSDKECNSTNAASHGDEHAHGHGDEHAHDHGDEPEGVVLSEETLREKGITLETAGPGNLARVLKVNGRVEAEQRRSARLPMGMTSATACSEILHQGSMSNAVHLVYARELEYRHLME